MARKEASIYKRKDGRWEARYVKEIGVDGKKRYGSVYGKTYTEAQQRRFAIIQDTRMHGATQHLYTIGKKNFIVNSVFDLNGKQTVADGIKRLIDNEFNSAA